LVSGFLGFYCDVVEISVLLRSEALPLFSDILTLEGETTTGINYPVMQQNISEERNTPMLWLVVTLEDIIMFKINFRVCKNMFTIKIFNTHTHIYIYI